MTKLEAGLGHLPAEVQRLSRASEQQAAAGAAQANAIHDLTRAIEKRDVAPDPTMQQLVLALHNLADAQRSPAQQPSATWKMPTANQFMALFTGAVIVLLLGAAIGGAPVLKLMLGG